MRLFVLIAALAIAGSAVAQEPPDAAPSTPVTEIELPAFEPSREDAVLEAYVDGVVGAHRREHGAPAVSVSVVRGGRTVFARGYGVADVETGRAADGETMFRIGSVSKTFTWTAVMMLADRGLIDLDADVNVYLKDLRIPDAFDAPVTMNHLMAHRAGFEDTLAVFRYADDAPDSLTEALAATMPARVYAPGARTSYSNWGAALAAKIVEDVSGVPYADFLQREILTPLGMNSTTLRAPKLLSEDERAAMAKGYALDAGAWSAADYMEIGPFAPAGAMASTAADMARWTRFHLNEGELDGARLMSVQTHRLMTTRAFDDRRYGADLAHGLMSRPHRGVETFGHGGATALFFTYWMFIPSLDAGVFVSQSAADDRTLTNDLPWLVVDHLIGDAARTAADDAAFDSAAAAFAGDYLNNRRSFTRFEKLFSTSNTLTVAPAKGGLTLSTEQRSLHAAPVPGAADTFETRDGLRFVFGRDEKGRVTHVSDPSGVHSYERQTFATNPAYLMLALGIAMALAAVHWIGAWRRQGRSGEAARAGGLWGATGLAGAATVFALAGGVIAVSAQMSSASAAAMLDYPPLSITALRAAAYAVVVGAALMLASLWPVWRSSPWRIWRKLHHTALALALAFLSLMLIVWNVVFSATA